MRNLVPRPYLNANKRELLADYALPVAVIVLSFLGSYIFRDIKRELSYFTNRSLHMLGNIYNIQIRQGAGLVLLKD